jgi:hypothetical protein
LRENGNPKESLRVLGPFFGFFEFFWLRKVQKSAKSAKKQLKTSHLQSGNFFRLKFMKIYEKIAGKGKTRVFIKGFWGFFGFF